MNHDTRTNCRKHEHPLAKKQSLYSWKQMLNQRDQQINTNQNTTYEGEKRSRWSPNLNCEFMFTTASAQKLVHR